jgi:hypothetical protein
VTACGFCADGWLYEVHDEKPLTHHVSLAEANGHAFHVRAHVRVAAWHPSPPS